MVAAIDSASGGATGSRGAMQAVDSAASPTAEGEPADTRWVGIGFGDEAGFTVAAPTEPEHPAMTSAEMTKTTVGTASLDIQVPPLRCAASRSSAWDGDQGAGSPPSNWN